MILSKSGHRMDISIAYGPFSFCLPKKKMGEKKKGTEIELPVESRRPHKPTISTHRGKTDSESRCGWVEIETHGFSRPSHAAIDFRGSGPFTRHSPSGFIHHTLYPQSTELPKLSEGALDASAIILSANRRSSGVSISTEGKLLTSIAFNSTPSSISA